MTPKAKPPKQAKPKATKNPVTQVKLLKQSNKEMRYSYKEIRDDVSEMIKYKVT